jgi:hypothetical protein
MPTIETNIHEIWAAKQSAQGVPATVAARRFKLVGGSAPVANPDFGSEPYSDGSAYGDATDWFNSLLGQGQPALEGGTDELAWLLWIFSGNETVSPSGTNEVQTLTVTGTPTGGSLTLSLDGRPTATIAFNAAASAVQSALEALPNIGTGNVVCAGGPLPGSAVTITFQGALAKRPIPNLVATSALTGGSSPTAAVAETTPGVLATHTFTAQNALGFWSTWWQTVGSAQQQKLKHNDARMGGLQIEASSGTKALHASPQLLCLDPAEVYAVDPTVPMPTSPVMLFTEGAANWQIDSTVIRGFSQFQLQLAYNLSPIYGDDIIPFDVTRGNASAVITVTTQADDVMQARWNNWLYGTPTPAAGTKPIKRLPPLGAFHGDLVKKDSAGSTIGELLLDIPGVRWQIPDSVAPNPGQGSQEISITGQLRKLGTNPLYTLSVGCQSAAFTA